MSLCFSSKQRPKLLCDEKGKKSKFRGQWSLPSLKLGAKIILIRETKKRKQSILIKKAHILN